MNPTKQKKTTLKTAVLILLKAHRESSGSTQKYMSDGLGLKSAASFGKIENGSQNFTLNQFYMMCQLLMVPPFTIVHEAEIIGIYLRHKHNWLLVPELSDPQEDDLLTSQTNRKGFDHQPGKAQLQFIKVPASISHLFE